MSPGLRISLLRAWRIGALVAIACIVGAVHRLGRDRGSMPIGTREVLPWYPSMVALDLEVSPGGQAVRDGSGAVLGTVLTTSPDGDRMRGYAGPSEVLLALGPGGELLGAGLRRSADTPEHVADVCADRRFWSRLVERPVAELAAGRGARAPFDAVSGATATSSAIVDAVGARLARAFAGRAERGTELRFGVHDALLALFALCGLVLSFARDARRLRIVFRGAAVAYVGVATGELLALSLGAGFAQHGVPWWRAPGLVILALCAVFVPWATGRNPYCGQICPHGVVQAWIGRLARGHVPRVRLPATVRSALRAIPTTLLVVAVSALVLGLPLDLASLEAFDAWSLGFGVSAGIAIVGGLAAAFEPMAYCRFGCATGRVLSLVTVHSHAGVDRRDALLAVLLVIAGLGAISRGLFEAVLVGLPW